MGTWKGTHSHTWWRSSALFPPAMGMEVVVASDPRHAGLGAVRAWKRPGLPGATSIYVRRLSLNVSMACLVRAHHSVLPWARGSSSFGVISAWLMLAFTQSLNLQRGLPCFRFPEASSPNTSCFGSLLSSMQMTCPTQWSWLQDHGFNASWLGHVEDLKVRNTVCRLMFKMVCSPSRHPLSGSPEGFRPSPGLAGQPRRFTRVWPLLHATASWSHRWELSVTWTPMQDELP